MPHYRYDQHNSIGCNTTQGDQLSLYKDDSKTVKIRQFTVTYLAISVPPDTKWLLCSNKFRRSHLPETVHEFVASLWSTEGKACDLCWSKADDGLCWVGLN